MIYLNLILPDTEKLKVVMMTQRGKIVKRIASRVLMILAYTAGLMLLALLMYLSLKPMIGW